MSKCYSGFSDMHERSLDHGVNELNIHPCPLHQCSPWRNTCTLECGANVLSGSYPALDQTLFVSSDFVDYLFADFSQREHRDVDVLLMSIWVEHLNINCQLGGCLYITAILNYNNYGDDDNDHFSKTRYPGATDLWLQ